MSTIAGARGQKFAMMHCSKKHSFLLNEAYTDDFGTWCPECGSDAHSYKSEDCCFCNKVNKVENTTKQTTLTSKG
jgi:uncharacterized OB-fold protein